VSGEWAHCNQSRYDCLLQLCCNYERGDFSSSDGFRKVVSNEAVNLKMDKDDVEFAHQYFVQGQERLLEFIKRKVMLDFSFKG